MKASKGTKGVNVPQKKTREVGEFGDREFGTGSLQKNRGHSMGPVSGRSNNSNVGVTWGLIHHFLGKMLPLKEITGVMKLSILGGILQFKCIAMLRGFPCNSALLGLVMQ